MNIKKFYEKIGGNYDDVLNRLPTEEFIIKFVKRFPSDATYNELIDAVKNGDIEKSYESAHKLKGVVSNLGFTNLQNALSDLTEQLRPKTEMADIKLMKKITKHYKKIISKIAKID